MDSRSIEEEEEEEEDEEEEGEEDAHVKDEDEEPMKFSNPPNNNLQVKTSNIYLSILKLSQKIIIKVAKKTFNL